MIEVQKIKDPLEIHLKKSNKRKTIRNQEVEKKDLIIGI